jgi:hypothetical protein
MSSVCGGSVGKGISGYWASLEQFEFGAIVEAKAHLLRAEWKSIRIREMYDAVDEERRSRQLGRTHVYVNALSEHAAGKLYVREW